MPKGIIQNEDSTYAVPFQLIVVSKICRKCLSTWFVFGVVFSFKMEKAIPKKTDLFPFQLPSHVVYRSL